MKAATLRRPKIPIEVQRQVFFEAGHRCAVCGEAFPLEKAHIVAWNESADHSAANLICLCPNCHTMADKCWDEATLRMYKQNPWIFRRHTLNPPKTISKKIAVTILIDLEQFTERDERFFLYATASFFGVSPDQVKLDGIRPGSVVIQLSIAGAEDKKIDKLQSVDSEVKSHFKPYEILKIELVNETGDSFKLLPSVEDFGVILTNYFGINDQNVTIELSRYLVMLALGDNSTGLRNQVMNLVSRANPELPGNAAQMMLEITDGSIVTCPRCSGSGYVDWSIIRGFRMNGRWRPGICRYCDSRGTVPLYLALVKHVLSPPP